MPARASRGSGCWSSCGRSPPNSCATGARSRSIRERLARHLTKVSAEAGLGLNGPEHRLWRARLDAEAIDLQEALRWAVANDRAQLAVGLAAPLARWWWARGELVPMGEMAEATARLPSAADLEPGRRRAAALGPRRDPRRAGQVRRRRPAVRRPRRGRPGAGRPVDARPRAGRAGDDAAARRPAAAGPLRRRAWRPCGAAAIPGRSPTRWSRTATSRSSPATCPGRSRAHEEALDLVRSIGDDHLTATLLDQLAFDSLLAGDVPAARERLVESAHLHREVRDQEGLAYCLDGLAALCLTLGDPHAAGRLAGAAEAARAALGVTVWPLLQSLAAQLDAMVATALGPDDDRRERAAGAAAGPWTALDEGLAVLSRAG